MGVEVLVVEVEVEDGVMGREGKKGGGDSGFAGCWVGAEGGGIEGAGCVVEVVLVEIVLGGNAGVEVVDDGPEVLGISTWCEGKELGAVVELGSEGGTLMLKFLEVAVPPSESWRKKTAPLLRSCVMRPFQVKEPVEQFSAQNITLALDSLPCTGNWAHLRQRISLLSVSSCHKLRVTDVALVDQMKVCGSPT